MAERGLAVVLSADLDKFKRGLDEASTAADKSANVIEGRFRNINPDASQMIDNFRQSAERPAQEAGSSIGLLISGAIIASLVGIGTGVLKAVNSLAEIGDKAEELRLPVNLLQALSVAATEARVPLNLLNTAMDSFAKVSKQDAEDSKKFREALGNINAEYLRSFDRAKTQAERLGIVSNAFKSTTDEVKRAQLAQQAFGTDNEKLIGIFANGSQGLNDYVEKVRSLGLNIDENMVKKAQEAKSQISLLSRVLTDEFSTSLAGLIPILIKMLPYLERLGALVRDTLAAFATSDAQKPIESLQNEMSVLQKELDRLDNLAAQLEQNKRSPSTSVRDELRKLLTGAGVPGLDVSVDDELKDIDNQISAVKKRMDEIDTLLDDRARRGSKGLFGTDAGPGAFKPRPGLGRDATNDAFDRAANTIEKRTAATKAEAENINLLTGARERARIVAELETVAIQANTLAGAKNTAVTKEQRERINEVADAYGKAVQALELAHRPLETFGREAEKVNLALNKLGATGLNDLTNDLADMVLGTRTAADAFKQLTNSIIADLVRIAIRKSITGPLALGLGSLLDKITIPGLAAGTDDWRGGPVVVGEEGPELVNLPRGSQVFPTDVARNSNAGGLSIHIENHGADIQPQKPRQTGNGTEMRFVVRAWVQEDIANGHMDPSMGRYGAKKQVRRR